MMMQYRDIEGDGYATPEDAVTAYIEALKTGDLDQMVGGR